MHLLKFTGIIDRGLLEGHSVFPLVSILPFVHLLAVQIKAKERVQDF